MNKIYLFAIASILATASLMAGTFTFSAMAQAPTTPTGDASSTTDAAASNTTVRVKIPQVLTTQLHLIRCKRYYRSIHYNILFPIFLLSICNLISSI